MIVFVFPCNESLDYIKRVVAIPGDVVQADTYGNVYVNDEPVQGTNLRTFDEYDDFSAGPPTSCLGPMEWRKMKLDNTEFGTLFCPGIEPFPKSQATPFAWDNRDKQACPRGRPRRCRGSCPKTTSS